MFLHCCCYPCYSIIKVTLSSCACLLAVDGSCAISRLSNQGQAEPWGQEHQACHPSMSGLWRHGKPQPGGAVWCAGHERSCSSSRCGPCNCASAGTVVVPCASTATNRDAEGAPAGHQQYQRSSHCCEQSMTALPLPLMTGCFGYTHLLLSACCWSVNWTVPNLTFDALSTHGTDSGSTQHCAQHVATVASAWAMRLRMCLTAALFMRVVQAAHHSSAGRRQYPWATTTAAPTQTACQMQRTWVRQQQVRNQCCACRHQESAGNCGHCCMLLPNRDTIPAAAGRQQHQHSNPCGARGETALPFTYGAGCF